MRDLQELFEKAKDYLDVIGVPYSKDIEWIKANNRYTTRYGNCRRYYNYNKSKYMYQLQIAKFLLSDEIMDEKVVLSTIIHEIIHTCDGCMPHNAKFHHWGDLVSNHYGIEITTTVSKERAEIVRSSGVAPKSKPYKWEYHCPKCGLVYRNKRRPNDLAYYPITNEINYCCSKCKGTKLILDKHGDMSKVERRYEFT